MAYLYSFLCGLGCFIVLFYLVYLSRKYPDFGAWFSMVLLIVVIIFGLSAMFYDLIFS